ncbi:outer membrane beta-barrel protein [Algoriphagus aquimarinus]|uniref:Outer membrane protein beta-barrel domain-containing protein n=1 Tax=Algoriphagus aquimarinus TaxID=237018 RepID=A0A1I1C8G0_9BACT|nr:outer membrane beta-barrel protein [Algoriphagus aquimarinus]SFB59005.1 Outer membrane protein beta-barrel domain-containing protein [Algoriphagus aquimarinus]|tara:strand:+ start:18490 stop:19080 length:591 start_codon:yes stop_codon:yes gene_type:complete
MKNVVQVIFAIGMVFLFAIEGNAQRKGSGFGIKAGMNYNTSGKYFKDAGSIWNDPGASIGYQVGTFYKLASYDIFLRPELLYTHSKFESGLGQVKYDRLDAPIMAGFHMFKVLSIVGGPSFHYSLNEEFPEVLEIESGKKIDFGYQFGLGLNVGPVGLDLRYERVFNDQKLTLDRVLKREDSFKSEQVVLALSFQF